MYRQSQGNGPFWIWGVIGALAIIVLTSSGRFFGGNDALKQRFAPQPTVPGADQTASAAQPDWFQLPESAKEMIRQAQEKLGQGQNAPVLTPVAQSARLKVEVHEVRPTNNGVQVVGQVTNISSAAIDVPVSAFQFRDSAGNVYASSATTTTHLEAGASTPLDLGVPLAPGRGLSLIVRFSPDPPIEQSLIFAPQS